MNIETLMGLEKVSILQCEELAKDHGYNSMTFDIVGPSGSLQCKWLDAYMGMFQIIGKDGFLMTRDFQYAPDIYCKNLQVSQEEEK